MRAKIKAILSPLVENNSWASHNWDREPVPALDDSPVSSDDVVGDRRDFGRRRRSPDSPDSSMSPPPKRHALHHATGRSQAKSKSRKARRVTSLASGYVTGRRQPRRRRRRLTLSLCQRAPRASRRRAGLPQRGQTTMTTTGTLPV